MEALLCQATMVQENYENGCRLCFNTDSRNVNLFENNSYTAIIKTIHTCLSIKISQNDKFPKVICKVCMEKIVSWESYKKLCRENQDQLQIWWQRRERQFVDHQETNQTSTDPRSQTSIRIKEEIIEERFDNDFEYTYETLTPDFNIKLENTHGGNTSYENHGYSKKSMKAANECPPPRMAFDYELVLEMVKDGVCKFCSKMFNRNSNLIQHLRFYHMFVPFNLCFNCGKSSKTNMEAKSHRAKCRKQSQKNINYREPDLTIENSNETVPTIPSDYKFSCAICGKLFKTIEEWTVHRTTHVLKINDGISSFEVVIDEKTVLGKNNDETSMNHSVSEISDQANDSHCANSEQLETPRSEDSSSAPTLEVYTPARNKKSSKLKRKFGFVHKSGKHFKCECGRTFNRIQAYSSHKRTHSRKHRTDLSRKPKKHKDEIAELGIEDVPGRYGDGFKCDDCDRTFGLASKFRFHKKFCNLQKTIEKNLTTPGENNEVVITEEPVNEATDLHSSEKLSTQSRCSFCKKKFQTKNQLFKHQTYCDKRPTDYRKFLKIHPRAVQCGICRKCFINGSSFYKHSLSCRPSKVFGRNLTEEMDSIEEFNSTEESTSFEDTHYTEESAESLRCEMCKRICQSRGGLTEHRKRCHYQLTSRCIECTKLFASFFDFRLHYKKHHDRKARRQHSRMTMNLNMNPRHFNSSEMNTKTWTCKKCRKILRTLKGFKYHMRSHDKDPVTHVCFHCGSPFYDAASLMKHIEVCPNITPPQTHTNETEIEATSSQLHISLPKSAISVAAAPCAVCNMSFETISELREHILINHKPAFMEERKKQTFFCQFCKMAFDRHGDLKQHFKEYHAEDIKTDANYRSPPVLKAERPESSSANNSVCSSCQLSFDSQEELVIHVSTFHNVEM